MSYITPLSQRPGGCWTCTHWHGETTDQGRSRFAILYFYVDIIDLGE